MRCTRLSTAAGCDISRYKPVNFREQVADSWYRSDLAGVDLLRLAEEVVLVAHNYVDDYPQVDMRRLQTRQLSSPVYYLYHESATSTPKLTGLYLAGVDLLRLAEEVVVVADADVDHPARAEEKVEVLARGEQLSVGVEVGKRGPLGDDGVEGVGREVLVQV